ncbi:hypothetical protein PHLCEN_2v7141 [Hermanssonia centrifuga]|uniref:Uncharacterized protein n=1 Tax=Hermanssonia centrifuga TaxID=98765 RepID=A0A2R6NXE7_9APHY|nr:hypothetical protein PHLCEN_2v7141 [Hermanssonia centrifuga]
MAFYALAFIRAADVVSLGDGFRVFRSFSASSSIAINRWAGGSETIYDSSGLLNPV